MINQQTVREILESKIFQESLARAVAPQVTKQVNSLVAPTLKKISHIEEQVDDLHNYVSGNKEWQSEQNNRQANLQNSMNQMQSSMNAIITLFQENKEKETGNKRSAPNEINNAITSPTRRQKKDSYLQSTIIEDTQKTNNTQSDQEACNPLDSDLNTFTQDSSDEAMTPAETTGEGGAQ